VTEVSVGQFVSVLGPHMWPKARFLLLSDICGLHVVGSPPWQKDESVIYLNNFLSLSGSAPKNSLPHLTVSSETPPIWRARSPYLYPPGTGWSSYTPEHWVPFLTLLMTHRATVEVLQPAYTRVSKYGLQQKACSEKIKEKVSQRNTIYNLFPLVKTTGMLWQKKKKKKNSELT
jgi:hypothetical protein